MTDTQTVTLSYKVTRTLSVIVDVTPEDAREAHDMGETCAQYAREVADCYPASMWDVDNEDVTPA